MIPTSPSPALRVMVVDDSKVQLQFAIELCTAQGWSVVELASDGLEALLKLRDKRNTLPDLLLLDLEMPGLNGIDLLQELARLGLTLPICILSSRELGLLESVLQMGRQLGLNIIQAIQKPLRAQALQGLRLQTPVAPEPAQPSLSADQIASANLCTLYTPCVALETGLIHHLCARLVWQHPENGRLLPLDYAAAVLDDEVFLQRMAMHLQEVLLQVKEWKSCGSSMAVQLELPWAAMQSALNARSLLEQVRQMGITESKLTFEIAIAQPNSRLASHLSALNLLRIENLGLAIRDDLAEFAWVAAMRKVPFSQLVLGAQCLAQCEHDPFMPVLIEQSIQLAHRLNLNVHLEGMSRLSQWQFLRRIGCNSAQGSLIGEAMPADEVIPWIKENLANLRQLAEQAHQP